MGDSAVTTSTVSKAPAEWFQQEVEVAAVMRQGQVVVEVFSNPITVRIVQ